MKNRKRSIAFFLFVMLLLCAAGCGSSGDLPPLPTLAPTHTPKPMEDDTPTPTVAPDADYTKIIALDGEDFNQVSNFRVEGEGSISVKPIANTGSYSFYYSGRGETWHNVNMDIADKKGNQINVIGKNVYVAMWVYHETGKTESFSCSMYVKKPDGSRDVGASLTKYGVKSHTWTLIQGILPVYANVTEPKLRIEMTSGKSSFYIDDFRITYDPASSVGAKAEYNVTSFEGLYFDFEDGKTGFDKHGENEILAVKAGGVADGTKCLSVTNRKENWNGPELDLSEYGLAGSTIWVSYSAVHEGDKDTEIKCTMIELPYGATEGRDESYNPVATTVKLAPGTWGKATGKITLKGNTERAILYFETAGTENFSLDNVMISGKDISKVEVDPATGQIIDKINKMDTSGFVTLYRLTADGIKDESSTFHVKDNAKIARTGKGHSENGFKISNRTQTYSGVELRFDEIGKEDDIIGKKLFVSFWVYQETDKALDIAVTLEAKKPDGTTVWPEKIQLPSLPSGTWTYVEGLIPIYANVKAPKIYFEMPSSATAEYILDDITVAYDPNSNVPANKSYADAEKDNQEKTDFKTIVLDFEDNNAFFTANGGKIDIRIGGHESDKCLYTFDRSAHWNGGRADFSKYNIQGKTLNVSFWLYHEYSTPLEVKLTAEMVDESDNQSWRNIVIANAPADGKWHQYSGKFDVPATGLKKIYVYFESDDVDASYYLDDVVFEAK